MQPCGDTVLDMAKQPGSGCSAYSEEYQPNEDPAGVPGGNVQHTDKHREEEQRRSQVALKDKHAHA